MKIDWESLYNILWFLIIFIAPGIIGLFKKDKEEDERDEREIPRALDLETLMGTRPVNFNELKEQERNNFKDRARLVGKEQKVHASQKRKVQLTTEPQVDYALEYAKSKEANEKRIKAAKSKLKKETREIRSIGTSIQEKPSVLKKLSAKRMREAVVWKEILDAPKALASENRGF